MITVLFLSVMNPMASSAMGGFAASQSLAAMAGGNKLAVPGAGGNITGSKEVGNRGGSKNTISSDKKRLLDAKDDEGTCLLLELSGYHLWAQATAQCSGACYSAAIAPHIHPHSSCTGITSLMKAAETGEHDVVDFLLEQGATVDARDDEAWNALMWAAVAGKFLHWAYALACLLAE